MLVYELSGCGLPVAATETSYIALVSNKEFDIQVTIECRSTQKRVHDMIRTYSQSSKMESFEYYKGDLSRTLCYYLAVKTNRHFYMPPF